MNESNDALGGQRVYMTQPSLVEQARELAARRVLPEDRVFDRINEQRLMIEKLADELDRANRDLRSWHDFLAKPISTLTEQEVRNLLAECDAVNGENQRLTDALDELVDALASEHYEAYDSDAHAMSPALRDCETCALIAKHRPVASEEDR